MIVLISQGRNPSWCNFSNTCYKDFSAFSEFWEKPLLNAIFHTLVISVSCYGFQCRIRMRLINVRSSATLSGTSFANSINRFCKNSGFRSNSWQTHTNWHMKINHHMNIKKCWTKKIKNIYRFSCARSLNGRVRMKFDYLIAKGFLSLLMQRFVNHS